MGNKIIIIICVDVFAVIQVSDLSSAPSIHVVNIIIIIFIISVHVFAVIQASDLSSASCIHVVNIVIIFISVDVFCCYSGERPFKCTHYSYG